MDSQSIIQDGRLRKLVLEILFGEILEMKGKKNLYFLPPPHPPHPISYTEINDLLCNKTITKDGTKIYMYSSIKKVF